MLEDINNIMNSGDVTGIYQEKDMEDITAACKADCAKKKFHQQKPMLFTQYLIRVKRNIHMIIVMSPLANMFTTRLRMFPSFD
jgi:dynein heavy chain